MSDTTEYSTTIEPVHKDEAERDGGYGWIVVAGAFLAQFTTFGTSMSWGIMQAYYDRHLFPGAQLQLSFAGTLMELFFNLGGPIYQVMSSKMGIRFVLVLASILITLGLELAGFSTEIWHLYLTQGVLFGASASLLYVMAMGVPPQWFNKRRGLGLGLVASGSGVGGLVLPIVLTQLNNTLGIAWTYRILGFICLGCNCIVCLLVKEKYPRNLERKARRSLFAFKTIVEHLEPLKDTRYILWATASVIAMMGFFVPFFFLPSYVDFLGMSDSDSAVFMAVLSAGNVAGRIAVGWVGDRIGRLNADILFTASCGLCALCIWTFAKSFGTLMAFSAIFGLFCSSYIVLMSPITAMIVGMDHLQTGLSVLLLTNVISVFGPNIASAIQAHLVDVEPYLVYKVFTGTTYLIGALLLFILKLIVTRSPCAHV